MQKKITVKIPSAESNNEQQILNAVAAQSGFDPLKITGIQILKKSLDARSKTIWSVITVNAFIDEPFSKNDIKLPVYKDVTHSPKSIIIIGGGPAGIFAALKAIEYGIKPIILERGKEVRARRRDLAALNKEGKINPDSNYCFGEGGAGTYSDGKLYTRSGKRGSIEKILDLFVLFGADENIRYNAHPHIGTNKLPHIITAMRTRIESCGGIFFFEKKVTDFTIKNNQIESVSTEDGDNLIADAYILATGHSARDIFELLHRKNIEIYSKGFALGVRIEHPQQIINEIQYGKSDWNRNPFTMETFGLPPASYSLVQQINDRGVFSFCMCPGGIIATASTAENELVVNGWSPSKRNNPFANSGMVVQVEIEDVQKYFSNQKNTKKLNPNSPLYMMEFQKSIEKKAFLAGGGKFVAPAQRMVDFVQQKISSSLPDCSYIPGLKSADLTEVLPPFIYKRLQKAFGYFGKKMPGMYNRPGYFTNEAVLVGTESRTSSPVRIPRDTQTLQHIQIKNLYPCGEGAGYAGGIVSAAIDGERVATAMALST